MTAVETSPLENVLRPLAASLSPDAARTVVAYSLDSVVEARIDELAEKANEGQLTEAERAEYQQYIQAMDLVMILQLMARKRLSEGS